MWSLENARHRRYRHQDATETPRYMIDIVKTDEVLELHYESEVADSSWVNRRFAEHEDVRIRRTFTFTEDDMVSSTESKPDDPRVFTLGVVEGEYYRIPGRILGTKHDLYLQESMTINEKTFIAERVSIFKKLGSLIDEDVAIGGDRDNAIPLADFRHLQRNFPTATELKHYAATRISGVLRDYFDTMTAAERKLEAYLERREPVRQHSTVGILKQYEIEKWKFLRDQVESMLAATATYTEKQWQAKMLEFILLLFPKYVAVLENVQIKDFYASTGQSKNRYIDLALVDADGHIDVIEIKKPAAKSLLSGTKYRDNYTPRRELSGCIMQAEKYLFHLNKWGVAGEKHLNKKRSAELPPGLQLKIVNPKALVILGRDNSFSKGEKFDFEIIRRKYANVIDILTYDDLIRRLNNIIAQLAA